MREDDTYTWVVVTASLVVAITISWIVLAYGGEITDCSITHPEGQRDFWSYRTKVPGWAPGAKDDKCWYQGPPMKPRNELRWPVIAHPASKAERRREVVVPAPQPEREEVMPNAPSRGSPRGGTGPGGGSDTTQPALSNEELMARAYENLLRFAPITVPEPEQVVPLPRPRPRPQWPEKPPLWLFALLFIAPLAGAGLAFELLRRDHDDEQREWPYAKSW